MSPTSTLAPRGGAVFDINRFAIRAFQRAGIAAHHLQLGWSPLWDHLRERERDIDVLFMGCITDRRARALAHYARTFSRRRIELLLSDNSRPNWSQSQSFRTDERKWDLLGRAKVLINIHQDEAPYFEWLRIVQAISNGAVVVSEHSVDHAPLVPGKHLLMGDWQSLHLLTEMLLEDGDRWWRMQTAAYELARHELTLSPGVRALISAAARIAATEAVPDAANRFFTQPQPDPASMPVFDEPDGPPSPSLGDHNAAMIRRALKDVRLELLEQRRRDARLRLEQGRDRPLPESELVARSLGYAATVPTVSVLTALYNHSTHVTQALDSAARSLDCAFELIVVDDGSTDDSLATVRHWLADHQELSMLVIRHPVNRGLGQARNSALAWARAPFSFVLDADNEVYPHCFTRLVAALEAEPDAGFAYGTLESFSGSETLGLMNELPWEPSRLRRGNYIDAMAMIRTSLLREELGGYTVDHRLHGWEDFELWCRIATRGQRAIRVPEILARYRMARHSMLSLTNISATDAFSLIIEANPELMAGVQPPE